MSDPSLSVTLENAIAEVGGRFEGRLQRTPELDDRDSQKQPVRSVELLLRYRTEGRGSEDAAGTANVEFPVDQYGRLDATFNLSVPPIGPISYDGRLIRVMWEIQAKVDVRFQLDRKLQIPVLVIPRRGWGLYHSPHPLRTSPSR